MQTIDKPDSSFNTAVGLGPRPGTAELTSDEETCPVKTKVVRPVIPTSALKNGPMDAEQREIPKNIFAFSYYGKPINPTIFSDRQVIECEQAIGPRGIAYVVLKLVLKCRTHQIKECLDLYAPHVKLVKDEEGMLITTFTKKKVMSSHYIYKTITQEKNKFLGGEPSSYKHWLKPTAEEERASAFAESAEHWRVQEEVMRENPGDFGLDKEDSHGATGLGKRSLDGHEDAGESKKSKGLTDLSELLALIKEKDQKLQEKDKQLQEKDQKLQEKDKQLQEKDQKLQEKDQKLQEKDQQLQEKSKKLEDHFDFLARINEKFMESTQEVVKEQIKNRDLQKDLAHLQEKSDEKLKTQLALHDAQKQQVICAQQAQLAMYKDMITKLEKQLADSQKLNAQADEMNGPVIQLNQLVRQVNPGWIYNTDQLLAIGLLVKKEFHNNMKTNTYFTPHDYQQGQMAARTYYQRDVPLIIPVIKRYFNLQ